MEFRINLHSVVVDELAACFVVAFALDALHFAKELAYEFTHLLVVVNLEVGFAFTLDELYCFALLAVFENPLSDELTVAHVSFFDVLTEFDTVELSHEAVHNELVVFSLVSFRVVEDTEFDEFRVCKEVESVEVGTSFFESRAVFLHSVRVYTREELT